jgi:hypothetical protein
MGARSGEIAQEHRTMKLREASLLLIAVLLGLFGLALVQPRAAAGAQTGQQPGSPPPQAAPSAEAQAKADSLPIPVDEIIRKLAQHESEFKLARDNYTYTQTVLMQEIEPPGGEYQLVSDIVFTPQGRRYEQVTYAPQPTLRNITLSPEDMKDLENIQPFVLTTEDLPKYDVQYAGREKIDELNTYVFHVAPKRIEKNQRYFQGTLWADDQDLAVVKSDGKAVPDITKGGNENIFPRFETYRENIEGDFWFPTYTHADDTLHFKGGDVRIRMTVRYKNYKRFGATIKLGTARPVETPPASPQKTPQQ